MEPTSEKQFNTKSTYDTFDEIYTNYDISVDNPYSAGTGYPFDYLRKCSLYNENLSYLYLLKVLDNH